MKFSKKIFWSFFVATSLMGSALTWEIYHYVIQRTEKEFIARYSVFTHVIGDTLSRLDLEIETMMHNAAEVIASHKGMPSTEDLKAMRGSLGVTHIFIIDKGGRFVRSTNENPSLIPNLFSFCSSYRTLLRDSRQEVTPIIKPRPEPKPFKFLFLPSNDGQHIVEVGVRVDSIAKTVMEAIKADPNVKTMRLYSPNGTAFGRFSADEAIFEESRVDLPENLGTAMETSDEFKFLTKVNSSQPRCCQCDKAGTSKNGEYYYVLENTVAKGELKAIQANTAGAFGGLGVLNLLLSFLLSRFLSRKLVKNIEDAAEKVRQIKKGPGSHKRIQLQGSDEVAFLTNEFDRLLDTIESTQEKVIEAEKVEAKVQLARIVAHNIRSPIIAIEMLLPSMLMIPEKTKNILRNSVREIKELSERLVNQPEVVKNGITLKNETIFLVDLLEQLIRRKEIEYSQMSLKIKFSVEHGLHPVAVRGRSVDLSSVFSNIINNALESYSDRVGPVLVEVKSANRCLVVTVSDQGEGIPEHILPILGTRPITSKARNGSGVGLLHAFKAVTELGGSLDLKSVFGKGTDVRIYLPRVKDSRLRRSSEALP